MAEANKDATANPPATSGGLTKDEVNALLADAIKPLATTLQSLGENQKVIADTLAKLPPAAAAAATDAGTGGAAAAAGSTDAERPGEDRPAGVGDGLRRWRQARR
jgi:hypothetical protein